MNGHEMIDAYRDLAGGKGATTVSGSKEDIRELRKFCFENGVEIEADRIAPGTYRLTRREESRART